MDESRIKKLTPAGMKIELVQKKHAVLSLKASHGFTDKGVKNAVSRMLSCLGMDTRDPNLKDTPRRVAHMWAEWLTPKTLDLTCFESESSSLVTLNNHKSVSVCPHHMLPFELMFNIAYIPQDYVLGLSKLSRLANFVSGSFMLQEHISELVCELLNVLVQPKGVAVSVRGVHGCMRLRGVMSEGSTNTVTLKGVFLTDEKARAEFYHACGPNTMVF